jgi:hypothetical protein
MANQSSFVAGIPSIEEQKRLRQQYQAREAQADFVSNIPSIEEQERLRQQMRDRLAAEAAPVGQISGDSGTGGTGGTDGTAAATESAPGFDVEGFLNKQAETLAARDAAAKQRLEKAMAANQLMIQNFLRTQEQAAQQREMAEKVTMANMARAGQLANLKIGTSAQRGTSGIDAFKRRLQITPATSTGLALAGGTQSTTNKMLNV